LLAAATPATPSRKAACRRRGARAAPRKTGNTPLAKSKMTGHITGHAQGSDQGRPRAPAGGGGGDVSPARLQRLQRAGHHRGGRGAQGLVLQSLREQGG